MEDEIPNAQNVPVLPQGNFDDFNDDFNEDDIQADFGDAEDGNQYEVGRQARVQVAQADVNARIARLHGRENLATYRQDLMAAQRAAARDAIARRNRIDLQGERDRLQTLDDRNAQVDAFGNLLTMEQRAAFIQRGQYADNANAQEAAGRLAANQGRYQLDRNPLLARMERLQQQGVALGINETTAAYMAKKAPIAAEERIKHIDHLTAGELAGGDIETLNKVATAVNYYNDAGNIAKVTLPSNDNHGLANLPSENVIHSVQFGKAGSLPLSQAQILTRALTQPNTGANPEYLQEAFAQHAGLAPHLVARPKEKITFDVGEQYSGIIKSIQDALGSRTDKNYWDAKYEAEKYIYDAWIEWPKQALRVMDTMDEMALVSRRAFNLVGNDELVGQLGAEPYFLQTPNPIIKLNGYLKKNVNFTTPVYMVFTFRIRANKIEEARTKFGQGVDDFVTGLTTFFPSLRGKCALFEVPPTGNRVGYTGLMVFVRRFTGNLGKLNFTFVSKFGPTDSLYKLYKTLPKKYLKSENVMTGEELVRAVDSYCTEWEAFHQLADLLPSEFGYWFLSLRSGLISSKANIDIIKEHDFNAKVVTRAVFPKYLCYKYTLAKWFWGKEAALQKINKDRIKKYLTKDQSDLAQIYHFLGQDLKLNN